MISYPAIHRLLADRKMNEAEASCRRIVRSAPNDAEAAHLLGLILFKKGQSQEACRLLYKSIELMPNLGRYHRNLAAVLGTLGKSAEALEHSRQALLLEEQCAQGHHNLGVALERTGRLDEALDSYRRAIQLEASYAPAWSHLGNVLRQQGRIDEALDAYRQAVSLESANRETIQNLAATLWEQGNQDEVIECYGRLTKLLPDSPSVQSSLIFALYHDPQGSPERRLREAISWNKRHGQLQRQPLGRACLQTLPGRRLRVGFVSPDFIDHPCARNVLPIFRAYARDQFEFYCYSNVAKGDEMTARLRSLAGGWRDIRGMNDVQAADLIRRDKIDVLIDLSGHMGETRLPIFAHRPSPVQVQMTFPGTTGLFTMDYRITDAHSDPIGLGEQEHVEQLIRLPVALTYDPGELPPVGSLPLMRNKQVTFGCLNRPMKINDFTLAVWSKILRATPNSQLVLLSGSHDGRNRRLESLLANHDIRANQVHLLPRMSRDHFLGAFNEIDIALDCFPYNGDATTLDGLWMGVPLITIAGDSCVSRRGVSHLMAVGLGELIANDVAGYVRLAINLANNVPRLTDMRKTLRDRMQGSLFGNWPAYTRLFEQALRNIFKRQAGLTR